MNYPLLVACLLSATAAQAQLITDPAQATAARDTLFRQADQLRQLVQQNSPLFQTNARGTHKRRELVWGQTQVSPALGPLPVAWRQVTRYRRNGRVQQRLALRVGSVVVLQEYRLNGRTTWLTLPRSVPGTQDKLPRHIGTYLESGYVYLDRKQYVLPRAAQ